MGISDITPTGMTQKALYNWMESVNTMAAEIEADLESVKNHLKYCRERDGVIGGDHTMGVGTGTTTKVRMSAVCRYRISGVEYCAADAEGTLQTGEVTENKFGAWRILIGKTGAITTQRATANGTSGTMAYDSLEEAMLSLGQIAISASTIEIGYLVIQAAAGGFTPGTDDPKTADAAVTAATYYNVRTPRLDNCLTADPSVGLSEGTTDTQYAFGTINVRTNSINVAQIAADVTIAFAENDTVTSGGYSGHLFVTDVAGTAVISLNATGVAGAAVAMNYTTAALATAALDAVQAALPVIFTVIGRMTMLANKTFTFNTDDVAGTDGTATWTDESATDFARGTMAGTGVGGDPPDIPAATAAATLSLLNQ